MTNIKNSSEITEYLILQLTERKATKTSLWLALRKHPWEHQAGVAQAITPISMKFGQFKGLNQKLKNPKWFTFWI